MKEYDQAYAADLTPEQRKIMRDLIPDIYSNSESKAMTDMDKTGGPAFPHIREHVGPNQFKEVTGGGMTLRDYMAGQALVGLIGRNWDVEKHGDADVIEKWANGAYIVADVMIKARGE